MLDAAVRKLTASLRTSGAAWSFYRDNVEEEFTAVRVSGSAPANPLDELFLKR